jgi:peptidoglycan-associated lipoprotein
MRYFLVAVGAVALAMTLAACPKKKPKNPTCDSDDDCKSGEKCENKACVAKEDEAPECTKDADCDGGQVCKAGKCTACVSDGECGPGGNCEAGVCERAKACTTDEECEDEEDCVDGFCKSAAGGSTGGNNCELATIYFAFDDDTIQESEKDRLAANGTCIEQTADKSVYLFGHTDETGTDEYNIALSERRARSAADYLSKLGIDPARLDVVGKGETELTGTGDDQDRRVEFQFH